MPSFFPFPETSGNALLDGKSSKSKSAMAAPAVSKTSEGLAPLGFDVIGMDSGELPSRARYVAAQRFECWPIEFLERARREPSSFWNGRLFNSISNSSIAGVELGE